MDDFGTGYSSLSCVKDLSIDKLNIDRSFITNISTDERDAAIVKTIIALSRNLNMKVLAEGGLDSRGHPSQRESGHPICSSG
ncbi:EAL domain-containing protein [Paenibacillus sp. WST5]|uniref:EAL domain-containing protein n=2 Tax=Paenibacillus sedimenti TaxID=2770274 RepID=A0A926KUL7_9BACL|nr:EAL domain-containing protein [Paenibacillus sedimenti]